MEDWLKQVVNQEQLGYIRNQMANLVAVSQLLEHRLSPAMGQSYLSALNQSICQITRQVKRMELACQLDDENEVRIHPTPTDLSVWMEGFCRRIQGVLSQVGITFEWKPFCKREGILDADLVEQLLLELVCNAAKVSSWVSLDMKVREDEVVFTVEDHGPGLTDEQLQQVYDVHPLGTGGIGLALAQRIANLHGGMVMVCSDVDKGGKVVAMIPLRKAAAAWKLASSTMEAWDGGGLDSVLVGLSPLLPKEAFVPEVFG